MRAKFTLLTHFSGRYVIPVLSSDIRETLEMQRQQWNDTMVSVPEGNDTFGMSGLFLKFNVNFSKFYRFLSNES